MAKGGIIGAIINGAILLGVGGVATAGALYYFGFLQFGSTPTPAAYARANRARSMLGFGGTGAMPYDPDYTKYMPDYDNMPVSVRGEFDDYQLDNQGNTLRDLWPPVSDSDGYNPANPPISIRSDTISNF